MRHLTVLICSLLVVAGVATAQGSSGGPPDCEEDPDHASCQQGGDDGDTTDGNATAGNTTAGNTTADSRNGTERGPPASPAARECRGAEDRDACFRDYCAEHAQARDCRAYLEVRAFCGKERGPCHADAVSPSDAYARCRAQQTEARCGGLADLAGIHTGLRHISFGLDEQNQSLVDYAVDGRLLLEGVKFSDNGTWDVERKGTQVRFDVGDARLAVHDNPTATLWFRSDENASLFLMLPDGADVTIGNGSATIQYDGYRALLTGHHIESFDGGIVLFGEAGFHAPPASPPGDAVSGAVRDAMEHAFSQRHLGASVDARGERPDVTSYDELDVNVSSPTVINATDTLRVTVGANLTEGRTIVVDVDPERLAGPDLVVRYFDVHDDGNETEVVIREADSLADVMDPTDDAGQPEYWIVEDADGLHLMVSVPFWSVHAIELASVGEFLVQPSVLVGVVAGVGGVAVAGLAVFWPRREDEEY